MGLAARLLPFSVVCCFFPFARPDGSIFGAPEGETEGLGQGLNDFRGNGEPTWVKKCAALKNWDAKACGGWSPREMRRGIPKVYLTALCKEAAPCTAPCLFLGKPEGFPTNPQASSSISPLAYT